MYNKYIYFMKRTIREPTYKRIEKIFIKELGCSMINMKKYDEDFYDKLMKQKKRRILDDDVSNREQLGKLRKTLLKYDFIKPKIDKQDIKSAKRSECILEGKKHFYMIRRAYNKEINDNIFNDKEFEKYLSKMDNVYKVYKKYKKILQTNDAFERNPFKLEYIGGGKDNICKAITKQNKQCKNTTKYKYCYIHSNKN